MQWKKATTYRILPEIIAFSCTPATPVLLGSPLSLLGPPCTAPETAGSFQEALGLLHTACRGRSPGCCLDISCMMVGADSSLPPPPPRNEWLLSDDLMERCSRHPHRHCAVLMPFAGRKGPDCTRRLSCRPIRARLPRSFPRGTAHPTWSDVS